MRRSFLRAFGHPPQANSTYYSSVEPIELGIILPQTLPRLRLAD
jgi:hypothetical protein